MKHAAAFLKLVEEVMPRIREISADDVLALLEKRHTFTLIDAREDREWQASRIKGAVHMARGIIERDIENAIPDKGTKLVLYCGGGYRSALSADSLQKMGYTNVFSMAGGWREWCEKNYPKE
jgi:rhodanese-related sulfurtransferase